MLPLVSPHHHSLSLATPISKYPPHPHNPSRSTNLCLSLSINSHQFNYPFSQPFSYSSTHWPSYSVSSTPTYPKNTPSVFWTNLLPIYYVKHHPLFQPACHQFTTSIPPLIHLSSTSFFNFKPTDFQLIYPLHLFSSIIPISQSTIDISTILS